MQQLYDGLILYHGSYCEVREPDVRKCARRKDFGQGFYLTSSREQAMSFIPTSIAKAAAREEAQPDQAFGFISTFKVELQDDLACHVFETANAEWLHCIAAHRKRRSFPEIEAEMTRYDVIAGKIADDQTNLTLATYISGGLGAMGNPETDALCIRLLLPEKLKDQFCFKTDRAIACLKFVEAEKVWMQK